MSNVRKRKYPGSVPANQGFVVFYYDPKTNQWAFGNPQAVSGINEWLNWKPIEKHPQRAQRFLLVALTANVMENTTNSSFEITRSTNFPTLRLLRINREFLLDLCKKK
jgi:hypothetical protein